MKPWIPISLSFAFLSAALCAGYFYMEKERLEARLAALEDPEAAADEAEDVDASEAVADASSDSGGSQVSSMQVVAATETVSVEEEKREARRRERRERWERMIKAFEDPQMRLDMIERSMDRISERYSKFFQGIELSQEELIAVKSTMAEWRVLRWEGRIRSRMADTDEESDAIKEDFKERRSALSDEVDAILGEENAEALDRYQKALPYFDTVENFAVAQSYKTPLSDTQQKVLLDSYVAVNDRFEFTKDLSNSDWFHGSEGQDRGTIDLYFQERAEFDALVLDQASDQLSEEQLVDFAAQQLAERERDYRQMTFMLKESGS